MKLAFYTKHCSDKLGKDKVLLIMAIKQHRSNHTRPKVKKRSLKGKEKKQKRKEEQVKLAASQVLVDAANALEDPMSLVVPFKKYDRNGLTVSIDCHKMPECARDTVDWALSLLSTNMKSLGEDQNPVGFVHFWFDMDFDDEVLYCYEIQLVEEVRRKGLGKFLIQILEMLAYQTQMKKVMLTVFKHNKEANSFFVNQLKYEIDETSPSIYDPMNPEDYDYEILSKPIKKKKTMEAKSE
ncbi:putative N-alpha-acetyltransferase 40 [Apostichopus japonicus]|uniref:N-alpha-acetyltransferase 40 n=1 Tax=Stichopus japonicus TaxID=307972 RepID=A0A2G8JW22_STIJA|nr:putative N-alpha-acetyltransferase 40 [Apostichopus japonicus]